MFKLDNLRAPANSHHKMKRRGRGIGSGLGKTAGRGHKGQEARSGGGRGPWFEGGQTPIVRRTPKVGFFSFRNPHRVRISITELSAFAGQSLTLKTLIPKTARSDSRVRVSIFGTNPPIGFPKAIEVHHIAPAAKALLEKNGVSVSLVPYMSGRIGTKRKAKT